MSSLEVRVKQETEELLIVELLDALKQWREAKVKFAAVTALYRRPGVHPADANAQAAGDSRRQEAQAYTAYYRDEALMCAAALTALRGVREDLK